MKPLPFDEAIAWAMAQGAVLPSVYYGRLQGLARAKAFTVSRLASLQQIMTVQQSLISALQSGETLADWQSKVKAGGIGLNLPRGRLETIFRNNVQGAYSRGRCEQQAENVDTRPWYMYDAINDSRTRPSHAAMDGFVARYDDPIWGKWTPPCGHNCRCRRIALSEKQAARFRAIDTKRISENPELLAGRAVAEPDDGWDYNLCSEPTEGLTRAIERAQRAASYQAEIIALSAIMAMLNQMLQEVLDEE